MNWSYIAGYFDGEGHVGLHPARGRNGKRTTAKITTLCWYNSHRESLEAMREFMGVGFIGFSHKDGIGNFAGSKKPVYTLRISRKLSLIHAIDAMLPDLLIKKDACLALRQHLIDHVNEKRAENFGKLLAIPVEDYRRWYYDEGQSMGDIARSLGATPAGVNRVFRVHKLEARPAGGAFLKGTTKSPETRAKMKAARAKLWSDPEYAARMRSQLATGRHAKRRTGYTRPSVWGEHHHMSKLTDAQRDEMRQKYRAGDVSLAELATDYHVSKRTALNVIHDKIHRTVLLPVQEDLFHA
jgi:predicted DNA-binding protein YlxM (UPF0122 family)